MNNISLLLPKNRRPVLPANFDTIDETLDSALSDMISIPLLGKITAGKPIERVEDSEEIKVPRHMARKDTYALRVTGHSMIDDNIQDGDIVIIERRQSAENGQSVVALINDEQVTLKKFYIESDGIRLQPANPEMEAILLKNEEVEVLGVVTGVIRQFD
ncbi:MAG TPA: repressor LexA [Gammaproteobacteria bacterium]|nr:repressor LexA [Gammaproteobacteria bacterium]